MIRDRYRFFFVFFTESELHRKQKAHSRFKGSATLRTELGALFGINISFDLLRWLDADWRAFLRADSLGTCTSTRTQTCTLAGLGPLRAIVRLD